MIVAAIGVYRTARRLGRWFVLVPLACLGFLTLTWLMRGSLGLDRHFVVLVPLYATFVSMGIVTIADGGAWLLKKVRARSPEKLGAALAVGVASFLLVVHYDQLGNGRSTHLRDKGADFWTPRLFLDELGNLLRHLGIAEAYQVIGQSWGGMLAADIAMDISPSYFVQALPAAVKVGNLGLAMAKSVVFGAFIALIGCHWGLRVKPNTQSLGEGTTASVVSSITMVIIVDALFAVAFKNIGI